MGIWLEKVKNAVAKRCEKWQYIIRARKAASVKLQSGKGVSMGHIYGAVDEIIGRTPLLEMGNIEKKLGLKARLLVKLESFNPGGSAKDRVAKFMLDDAEKKGILTENSVIIEPTSGNTGIGLACVAASRGYRAIIVMPESMSEERRRLVKAYGAELVLTDAREGMKGAIEKAEELGQKIHDSFIAGQFVNPANPDAHYCTTGPEIWQDTEGNIDYFVAGIGTGGTITGVGRYLKEQSSTVKIVGIEPSDSPVISEGRVGQHKLQGIGAGFIPKILDTKIIDEIITVGSEEAYEAGRIAGKSEGVLIGISSGAALFAAIEIAKRDENVGKTVVALLPDTGERYLSTDMYE